jgi:hypothetical protein
LILNITQNLQIFILVVQIPMLSIKKYKFVFFNKSWLEVLKEVELKILVFIDLSVLMNNEFCWYLTCKIQMQAGALKTFAVIGPHKLSK